MKTRLKSLALYSLIGLNFVTLVLIILSLKITIIDDRDYPEDYLDVYYNYEHIGSMQEGNVFTFEYLRTGKTLK